MEAIESGPSSPYSSGRGGRREGAGRKPNREKFAEQVDAVEAATADRLHEYNDNLDKIACGLNVGWQEEWVAAGTVTVKRVLYHMDLQGKCTWQPYQDRNGKPIVAEQAAFPDFDPETMVCVERKVMNKGRDLKANVYLSDRILGKAAQLRDDPPEIDADRLDAALAALEAAALLPDVPPDVKKEIAQQLKEIAASLVGED